MRIEQINPNEHTSVEFEFIYKILDDGTVETKRYIGNETSVTVPAEIDGHKVKSIGEFTFADCEILVNVVISGGVEVIGRSAFSGCVYLRNVLIPQSVLCIESLAFISCKSITSIIIPSSVTTIGDGVFSNCERLTEIIVDESNDCFSSSQGVLFNKNKTELIQYPAGNIRREYTVANSVEFINNYAFYECPFLKKIILSGKNLKSGNDVFYSCKNLREVIKV